MGAVFAGGLGRIGRGGGRGLVGGVNLRPEPPPQKIKKNVLEDQQVALVSLVVVPEVLQLAVLLEAAYSAEEQVVAARPRHQLRSIPRWTRRLVTQS